MTGLFPGDWTMATLHDLFSNPAQLEWEIARSARACMSVVRRALRRANFELHLIEVELFRCHPQVTDHARQLLEKHLGMPFLNAGYSGPSARMNLAQVCSSATAGPSWSLNTPLYARQCVV